MAAGFHAERPITLHFEEEMSGLKRIVGSFPEASAFARSTLGALGFTGTLWICGRWSAMTGTLALASLLLIVLSTSSTGLAGAPAVLMILYATALTRAGLHFNRPYRSAAVLCAPLLVAALIIAVLLDDGASETVRSYLDLLIFNKSATDPACSAIPGTPSRCRISSIPMDWGSASARFVPRACQWRFCQMFGVCRDLSSISSSLFVGARRRSARYTADPSRQRPSCGTKCLSWPHHRRHLRSPDCRTGPAVLRARRHRLCRT